MPIYAYRCSACGHAQDVLQKVSDPLLTQCPACGQATYAKQVTAAGFQLKGSGWYVTDFRQGGQARKAGADAEPAKGADKPAEAGSGQGDAKPGAKAAGAAQAEPAAQPSAKTADKAPDSKAGTPAAKPATPAGKA